MLTLHFKDVIKSEYSSKDGRLNVWDNQEGIWNLDLSADNWCIDGIGVDEHYGTWYTIDVIMIDGKIYFLCEHEEYGDETANIIIDQNFKLVLDEVWNGFEDLADHLDIELDI